MDKQQEVRSIWQERFGDIRQWMEEVFTRIYNNDDARVITDGEGTIVSELLLRPYKMRYGDQIHNISYIYGAATRRAHQGKGYMSTLINQSLATAYQRGDSFVLLRPATRSLYNYYDRFGFATAVYIDEQRYTAAHQFKTDFEKFISEETIYDFDEVSAAYSRLSESRESNILHDAKDFKSIAIDLSLDDGYKAIIRQADTGDIVGLGFAAISDGSAVVRELVAEDDDAAEAVLYTLKSRIGNLPLTLIAPPGRREVNIHARGMARIANVDRFLTLVGASHPEVHQSIRVQDPLIEDNNRIFVMSKGEVSVYPQDTGIKVDLDVNINVLTQIFSSAPQVGQIFNLPTHRLFMSLMLD